MEQATSAARWPRRAAVPEDAASILALAEAIGSHAGTESLLTDADVRADFTHPDVVLERDTVVVHDPHGEICAYAIAYDEALGRSEGEILVHPTLDPVAQDDLLDALVPWFIEQALAIAERRALSTTSALLAASASEQRMLDAYARYGFSYVRTFWRMGLMLSQPHAEPFAVPGVTLQAVDPLDDDVLARLHALDQDAFADHYGFVAAPLEEFATQIKHLAGLDRHAVWIAVDDASSLDAGYLLGTDRRIDDQHGYIALLGVVDAFRGRGIAKALLATAFDYYKGRGLEAVQLGVDAQNTTGATELYRGVGMSEWETFEVWELLLTLDDAGA